MSQFFRYSPLKHLKNRKFTNPEYRNCETQNISLEIFIPKLIKEISAASFEAAAISTAKDFETRAIELHGKRSAEIEDANEKEIY